MTQTRRSRATRPEPRRVRLVARDLEVLGGVARMGFATTDQVQRLWFGDTSTASRRLAKLVAARLLDVHVARLHEPNVYTVTKSAIELLVAHDVDEAGLHRTKVGRAIDLHLKALNDLRVELVLAERAGLLDLRAFHSDLDLRRAARGQMPSYVPDAIVEVADADGNVLAVFAEIDLGTESVSTFADKVRVTVEAHDAERAVWGFDAGTWSPVAFAPTPGRARALARAIVTANGADLWFVTELGVLANRGAGGAIFARPGDAIAAPRGEPIPYRGRLPRAGGRRG